MQEDVTKKESFVHLHVHSTYSFQDGVGLPEAYAKRASELGQPALAVTDHGNISAHYKWFKFCKKNNVKPILGCEFYLVKSKDDIFKEGYNHITIIAKNNAGYRNLTRLVTKAWCEQFYYKPKITLEDLYEHREDLIVLSGCTSSMVMKLLREQGKEEAKELLKFFKENFKDFYVEIQPIQIEGYTDKMRILIDIAREMEIPLVATNDCHYILHEQNYLQEIMLCIQSKDKMSNPNRWRFSQTDFYLKTRKEMEDSLKISFPDVDLTDSLDNTIKIADSVDFEFPMATPIKYPIPDEEKKELLFRLCEDGLKKRMRSGEPEYEERLKYEIDLIVKKNFIDYFLVIADMIQWAKRNGILVGPARGSSAGSLACYALEITEVDPIKYDLIFERFIDINREDMPDIDIDFEDERRHEVKDYLCNKYGSDKVGNLPTVAVFKGKSALQDIGRVFEIPFDVTAKVKELVIERSGGDSRASFTLEDTFTSPVFPYPAEAIKKYPEFKYAIQLEGQYRQMGQHACGMVIGNEPLTNFCAIYKIKDEYVISLDYSDASSIGLLKIDILGLNTLSVISKTLKTIKKRHKKDIDIYNLPLDDAITYQGFIDGKLFGVFQFDGQAVNQVCRQIKPKDFPALYDISALARPGPLNSGSATLYIERRMGRKPVEYPHKLMEKFTKDTQGIVIYQEQVMQTMRQIGKMSWKDTAEIRKLISKSQGMEKFNKYKEAFSVGAKENGMTKKEIDVMWDSICTFGSWAFNKSHSVSYSIISYWTMYLKMHYPLEFYSSILSLCEQEIKLKKIVKESKREGMKILPIDINRSKRSFSIDEDGIRIGFKDIKGIGDLASEKIVGKQPFTSYQDFEEKTKGLRITKKVKQILLDLGAFDSIGCTEKKLTLFGMEESEVKKNELSFEDRFLLCPWDLEFEMASEWISFLEEHKDIFKTMPIPIEELTQHEGENVMVMGIIYDKNLRDTREVSGSKGKARTPKDIKGRIKFNHHGEEVILFKATEIEKYRDEDGNIPKYEELDTEFCNFILEDDTDFITARLSIFSFPHYRKTLFEELKPNDVVLVKGKMGTGIKMFFVNKLVCLRELKQAIESGDKERSKELLKDKIKYNDKR